MGRDKKITWMGRDKKIRWMGKDKKIRWMGRDKKIRWMGRDRKIMWMGRDKKMKREGGWGKIRNKVDGERATPSPWGGELLIHQFGFESKCCTAVPMPKTTLVARP